MNVIIDNFDFWNMPAMKYYAPSASWSAERKKDNAINKIFSNQWLAARKRDGAWMMFIKDMEGNMYLRPRTQNVKKEFVNKIDWVPHLHPFFEEVNNGTVFLGELYAPWDEQAKTTTSIMNCLLPKALKRQEKKKNKLHYYIFDVLAENGHSYLDMKAKDRLDLLNSFRRVYGENYHHWAKYYYGEELWQQLQNILAEGGEGMVILNEDSLYQPDKRSAKDSLKIKKELTETIDLVVIGANPPTKLYDGKDIQNWTYWLNENTNEFIEKPMYKSYFAGAPVVPVTKNYFHHWAGSLKLGAYKDGKLIEVGNLSGITDEIKANWKDYVGQVVEVGAMEVMDTGGIRHPKFLSVRLDKSPEECTMDQLK